VLAASCFAQAVNISAAIKALRASLVFIDRYPEKQMDVRELETVPVDDALHIAHRGGAFYRLA
jgi:hypothetical protein